MAKTVMIVDDDSGVQNLYGPYFKSKGYDVKAAFDGKEALAILEKEKVDLILLDLAMPELTGEELMERIVKNPEWKDIPIVIESALGPETGRPQKIKKQFTGKLNFVFFQRPSSLEEVNETIRRLLVL